MTIPKYVLNGERTGTCGKKKLPYVLSKQQLLHLLTFVKDVRFVMIIFIGCFQGLRIGEMLRLQWENVEKLSSIYFYVIRAGQTSGSNLIYYFKEDL